MLENFKLDFLDVQNEIEPPTTTLFKHEKKGKNRRQSRDVEFQIGYINKTMARDTVARDCV